MSKLFSFFILSLFCLQYSTGQELIRYDRDNPTAAVHYNEFLYGIFYNRFTNYPDYPAIGAYSPTGYALVGVKIGVGVCNYVYIPTESLLEPGQQYQLSLTFKIDEAYRYLPYYQDHFGIALSSDLFANHWGLWPKHFIPFGLQATKEFVTLSFEFRPLCTSNYLILGVFQGSTMDDKNCFACPYNFELHTLKVKKSSDPEAEFYYICDGFTEKKINNKWNATYDTDTIYFDSGSVVVKDEYIAIIDSIPNKLRTTQDLISLYAYTDKKGSENEHLGAARNATVRRELIELGVDSARILMTNYGETKSSHINSQSDRKVEIDVNLGKLYQKYYTEALQATAKGDYGSAQKKMMKYWMRMVPPEKAIYALYDCWGEGEKVIKFRQNLMNRIRSKFYKGKYLEFTLDSLLCENLDVSLLKGYLEMIRLPTYKDSCNFDTEVNWQKETLHFAFVDQIYLEYGFPTVEEVGKRGNSIIPSIILKSDDLVYLNKYLPLVKTACEEQIIPWKYYARLYDKISVYLSGFQRYGTQMNISQGLYSPLHPFENKRMVSEYRKQVKLAPLPDYIKIDMEAYQNDLEKPLITMLNTIHQSDQHYRSQTHLVEQQYGRESEELKSHWKLMQELDSLNLIKVKKILDQRGWLGPNVIGQRGSTALFLVIQHSDLETQLNYLPMMRKAVEKGDAKGQDLALLEDRVALGQGLKQIYGSQIKKDSETGEYYVAPILDPETVNIRRAEIGLRRIENYVRRWNIIWDIEKHKRRAKIVESKKTGAY